VLQKVSGPKHEHANVCVVSNKAVNATVIVLIILVVFLQDGLFGGSAAQPATNGSAFGRALIVAAE
jgi:hypothetical protein